MKFQFKIDSEFGRENESGLRLKKSNNYKLIYFFLLVFLLVT